MVKTPQPEQAKSKTYRSFALVYKTVASPLMKFIVKKMGGNTQAAEEVFSETVLAAYKGWHTFEYKSTYFTWVCRIALNKAADYYRKQIDHESRFLAPALEDIANIGSKELSPEEALVLKQLRESVKDCLDLLPDKKRQLLYLRYWKDLSIKKIAQTLGTSERAAEGKIYRAKLALREIMIEKYPEFIDQR